MNWAEINGFVDDVLITAGIAVIIVRQFLWRSARIERMLIMPLIVIAAGIVYLIVELAGGFRWVAANWLIAAEIALVALTGTAMGCATHFRTSRKTLQCRLTGIGIALWAVFVVIRVGDFALAGTLGANLADATGVILLSFGVNRLAAIVVVRRRAASRLAEMRSTGDGNSASREPRPLAR